MKKLPLVLGILFLVVGLSVCLVSRVKEVEANVLTVGSLALSDSRPSNVGTTYTADFSNVGTGSTVNCVQMFFSNMPTGGTAPTGIGVTGATVVAASDFISGMESWSINAATAGLIKITDATGGTPASASNRTVVISGITNGSSADTTYYLQFSTFGNTDCSTTPLDSAVVTFIYTSGQAVSLTVDPSLSFSLAAVAVGQTVNGAPVTVETTTSTIPFSTVTANANAVAAHTATVTTNAGSGYTVYIKYSGLPTSGSNSIDDLATHTNASPGSFSAAGTEAFGYTTEDTSLSASGDGADRFGSNEWAAFTATNTEVIYNSAAISSQATKIGYQVGIGATTPAGTYTTTVVLTATPTY